MRKESCSQNEMCVFVAHFTWLFSLMMRITMQRMLKFTEDEQKQNEKKKTFENFSAVKHCYSNWVILGQNHQTFAESFGNSMNV